MFMNKFLFLFALELCDENQVYPNATVLIQRNASTYTRKIECSEGYKAIGATEQYCNNRGKWNPYFQECASKYIVYG